MNPAIELIEEQARKDIKTFVRDFAQMQTIMEECLDPLTPREVIDNIKTRSTRNGELNEELYVKTLQVPMRLREYVGNMIIAVALLSALGGVVEEAHADSE